MRRLSLLILLLFSVNSEAADWLTWTGAGVSTNSLWSSDANWSGGTISSDDWVIFNTGTTTSTNDLASITRIFAAGWGASVYSTNDFYFADHSDSSYLYLGVLTTSPITQHSRFNAMGGVLHVTSVCTFPITQSANNYDFDGVLYVGPSGRVIIGAILGNSAPTQNQTIKSVVDVAGTLDLDGGVTAFPNSTLYRHGLAEINVHDGGLFRIPTVVSFITNYKSAGVFSGTWSDSTVLLGTSSNTLNTLALGYGSNSIGNVYGSNSTVSMFASTVHIGAYLEQSQTAVSDTWHVAFNDCVLNLGTNTTDMNIANIVSEKTAVGGYVMTSSFSAVDSTINMRVANLNVPKVQVESTNQLYSAFALSNCTGNVVCSGTMSLGYSATITNIHSFVWLDGPTVYTTNLYVGTQVAGVNTPVTVRQKSGTVYVRGAAKFPKDDTGMYYFDGGDMYLAGDWTGISGSNGFTATGGPVFYASTNDLPGYTHLYFGASTATTASVSTRVLVPAPEKLVPASTHLVPN